MKEWKADISRMLNQINYRKLTRMCGKEGLKKSGKKVEVIRRLVDNVPEKELRVYIIEALGIGKKILDHGYVPEHRIMGAEEAAKFLAKYGIKKWQLPKIYDRDPVVMLLGAKPGDILEIKRKSRTAGTTKYYRLVIRSSG
jgi:DNA-directed RNA polymerase subunit H